MSIFPIARRNHHPNFPAPNYPYNTKRNTGNSFTKHAPARFLSRFKQLFQPRHALFFCRCTMRFHSSFQWRTLRAAILSCNLIVFFGIHPKLFYHRIFFDAFSLNPPIGHGIFIISRFLFWFHSLSDKNCQSFILYTKIPQVGTHI